MKTQGFCVGIDLGSSCSKIAHGSKIIAQLEGFDLLKLREESEIFFDEPVFSCVIAIPENFSRDTVKINAKNSGFRDVKIITAHEAAAKYFEKEKVLLCDFGASKSDFVLLDKTHILDAEILEDVCGNSFDEIFSQWLCERFNLDLIDKKILREQSEQIKIALSENDFIAWRGVYIFREDFERLIHFTIKRAAHVAKRFLRVHKPDKIIFTGGCANIPSVKKIFSEVLGLTPEFKTGIFAKGAAKFAGTFAHEDPNATIKQLRNEMLGLEDKLTRRQKDKLYMMFRQIENTNDTKIISLMKNLLRDIRDA